MRSSRVLSFALLFCITFGIISGQTSASALYLVDSDIDPWGDLEDVKNPPIVEPEYVFIPDQSAGMDYVGEDPGIALLSLNDEDGARYIKMTGSIRFGFTSSSSTAMTNSQIIKTYDGPGSYSVSSYSQSTTIKNNYLDIVAGTYIDWSAPVEYASEEGATLDMSGAISFSVLAPITYAEVSGGTMITAGIMAYPDTVQLLVNGSPFGDVYSLNSVGSLTFSDVVSIPLDSSITRLGYRFTFTNGFNKITADATNDGKRGVFFNISDDAIFSHVVAPEDPVYNGILEAIVGWLSNLFDAIVNLPVRIVDGLLDGLKGLFVPSEADVTALKDKYDTLLRDRLGFIYQGFDATVDGIQTIVAGMEAADEYSFTVPEISFTLNGEKMVILEETPVSLDNAAMDTLRGLFGTAVCVICVGAWLSMAFDMVVALISGISYFEFLTKRKEEVDE